MRFKTFKLRDLSTIKCVLLLMLGQNAACFFVKLKYNTKIIH